jgi:hypothetical protein
MERKKKLERQRRENKQFLGIKYIYIYIYIILMIYEILRESVVGCFCIGKKK